MSGNPQFNNSEFLKSLKALLDFARNNASTYYDQQMNMKTYLSQKESVFKNLNELIERYGGGLRVTEIGYDSVPVQIWVNIEYEK